MRTLTSLLNWSKSDKRQFNQFVLPRAEGLRPPARHLSPSVPLAKGVKDAPIRPVFLTPIRPPFSLPSTPLAATFCHTFFSPPPPAPTRRLPSVFTSLPALQLSILTR